MIELRPYQLKAVDKIKNLFREGKKRVVLQLSTGAGKTVIFTSIAKDAVSKGNSVLVITDRMELLTQAGGTFEKFGIEPQYLTAKTKEINNGKLWIAMAETIKRRLEKTDYYNFIISFNLIIIDECHKNSFNRLFEAITPFQFVIGVTATPYRNGRMPPLKDFYDGLVIGEQISELISMNYLSKAIHYGVPIDGLNKIAIKAGEFDQKAVNSLYSTAQLFDGVVLNYRKYCHGQKALLFASGVESSKTMCSEFIRAGYSAIHLDAETPKDEREQILLDYKNDRYDVLCNVGILTTGYDENSIEVIIVYRPTMSLPLWLQMCGRGSRIKENKNNFKILDFGENVKRHGFWDAERFWSLENSKPPKKIGAENVKECHQCGALIPANTKICAFCGYEYIEQKKPKSAIEIILEELTPTEIGSRDWNILELEEIRKLRNFKQGWVLYRLNTYEEYKDYAKLKGYKSGWAYHKWSTRRTHSK